MLYKLDPDQRYRGHAMEQVPLSLTGESRKH
jgi:hypothetical protein